MILDDSKKISQLFLTVILDDFGVLTDVSQCFTGAVASDVGLWARRPAIIGIITCVGSVGSMKQVKQNPGELPKMHGTCKTKTHEVWRRIFQGFCSSST